MTIGTHPDLVASLAAVRDDVEQYLAGVSRFRAMRSIEKTMADLAEFQELVTPLGDIREQIERQLQETREYRALCVLDSIVPQLADVLALLDEKSKAPEDIIDFSVTNELQTSEARIVDVYERADAETADMSGCNAVAFVDIIDLPSEYSVLAKAPVNDAAEQLVIDTCNAGEEQNRATTGTESDPPVTMNADAPAMMTSESETPPSEDAPEEEASPAVATLAYNLANMLVQSLPPTAGEPKSETADQTQAGAVSPADADHIMQEGRAA